MVPAPNHQGTPGIQLAQRLLATQVASKAIRILKGVPIGFVTPTALVTDGEPTMAEFGYRRGPVDEHMADRIGMCRNPEAAMRTYIRLSRKYVMAWVLL